MLLQHRLDGTGWFAFESLKRMVTQHPDHRFIFFFDRPYHPQFVFADNITPVVLLPPARHPWLWYVWFEISLRWALKKYQPDMFFSPESFICTQSTIPQVAVIHDLNFEHFPEYLPPMVAHYYQKWTRAAAKKAAYIATVSAFSKQDIAATYNIDSSKIGVVYNGINQHFKPLSDTEKDAVRKKYAQGSRYVLYTGSLHKRKNAANMVRAFAQFIQKHQPSLKFVFVSDKSRMEDDLKQAIADTAMQDHLIFTGRLTSEALAQVTASAEALLYVSHFEGFGIPIIEAMRCHVPVIAGNNTCMPEVAADAALLCNSHRVSEITQAMEKVLLDKSFAQTLVMKGQQRHADFSWDKTADLLWQGLQSVLDKQGIK
jgi:glycosyltransferase involved in cell wall biosynthesis